MSVFKYRVGDIVYFRSLDWGCKKVVTQVGEVVRRFYHTDYGVEEFPMYLVNYFDKEAGREFIAEVAEESITLDTIKTMEQEREAE